jgi:DNA polymerase-3 subunit delta'
VWEKVNRLFARAESANLDRKQVILNALQTVEAAASA